ISPQELEEMGIRPGSEAPSQDTTYDLASSVCMDGDKVRFERDDYQWSGKENAFVGKPVLSVFDSKVGTTLYAEGGMTYSHPQANLQLGYTGWMDGPYLNPVALAYRPFLRPMSPIQPDALAVTGRKAAIEGKTCLELESGARGAVQRVWVDPSLDYAVV